MVSLQDSRNFFFRVFFPPTSVSLAQCLLPFNHPSNPFFFFSFQEWINSPRSWETLTSLITMNCWTFCPECPQMYKWWVNSLLSASPVFFFFFFWQQTKSFQVMEKAFGPFFPSSNLSFFLLYFAYRSSWLLLCNSLFSIHYFSHRDIKFNCFSSSQFFLIIASLSNLFCHIHSEAVERKDKVQWV